MKNLFLSLMLSVVMSFGLLYSQDTPPPQNPIWISCNIACEGTCKYATPIAGMCAVVDARLNPPVQVPACVAGNIFDNGIYGCLVCQCRIGLFWNGPDDLTPWEACRCVYPYYPYVPGP